METLAILARLLQQKEEPKPETFLTPEQLSLHATPFEDQSAQLQQQMQMAQALRSKPHERTSAIGAIGSGLGSVLGNAAASQREAQTQAEQREMLKSKQEDTRNFMNAYIQALKSRGDIPMGEAERRAASGADVNALAAPPRPMPLPGNLGDLDLFDPNNPFRLG